jgi:regulator of replication initiation timing
MMSNNNQTVVPEWVAQLVGQLRLEVEQLRTQVKRLQEENQELRDGANGDG